MKIIVLITMLSVSVGLANNLQDKPKIVKRTFTIRAYEGHINLDLIANRIKEFNLPKSLSEELIQDYKIFIEQNKHYEPEFLGFHQEKKLVSTGTREVNKIKGTKEVKGDDDKIRKVPHIVREQVPTKHWKVETSKNYEDSYTKYATFKPHLFEKAYQINNKEFDFKIQVKGKGREMKCKITVTGRKKES